MQQSYDTNRMVADQVWFALHKALETGLKDRTVDPNNPAELRALAAEAVRNNAALQAVVDSVNRYSLTVYDINIGDSQGDRCSAPIRKTRASRCPSRPNYSQLTQRQSVPA